MSLTIVPVFSGLDLNTFLDFPYSFYPKDSLWVPPIKSQERFLLSPTCHPFWNTAERCLFIAKRSGRMVGRIAAIIDHKYNAYAKELCGAFGFFECYHDQEACAALLNSAASWLKTRGMTYMRGPVNPSTNYSCGMLIDGFNEPPAIMMPYNPPYYGSMLEACHMQKEEDLLAYRIFRTALDIPPLLQTKMDHARANPNLSCRPADKKNLKADIKIMLDLYRESWAKNWYFSPLTDLEEEAIVKELVTGLNPEFFVLFFYKGQPAAGMVALPDLTHLLRKMRGSFRLSTPWDYLSVKERFQEGYRIMLFGIRPKYRLLGLPALLFEYMIKQAQKKPELSWVEGSWVLERNKPICMLLEDFSGTITKRYRIYRRELDANACTISMH
ncbi:MAG: hypothetical protein IJU79_06605 [Desulfovibrionaceae bacterium]|nr:hypothetical protein [Desulfovibrionaceae bacterium]